MSAVLFHGETQETFVVYATEDRQRVVVVTPWNREEGPPKAALILAEGLREQYGKRLESLAVAIEEAARMCLAKPVPRKKKKWN